MFGCRTLRVTISFLAPCIVRLLGTTTPVRRRTGEWAAPPRRSGLWIVPCDIGPLSSHMH